MASELYPQCRDSLAFPAARLQWTPFLLRIHCAMPPYRAGHAKDQAHILPNGVRAAGVGGGDLAQKQIGSWAAVGLMQCFPMIPVEVSIFTHG